MTLESLKQLTDDEIRIKVAVLTGWKDLHWGNQTHPNTMLYGWPPYYDYMTEFCVPNYPQNLDACYEMESTLTKHQRDRFEYELGVIVGPLRSQWRWHLLHATARQRCEAFILTHEQ